MPKGPRSSTEELTRIVTRAKRPLFSIVWFLQRWSFAPPFLGVFPGLGYCVVCCKKATNCCCRSQRNCNKISRSGLSFGECLYGSMTHGTRVSAGPEWLVDCNVLVWETLQSAAAVLYLIEQLLQDKERGNQFV